MENIEKRFGRILRRLREEKGFTQEQFAHHVNIDRSYYGQIERGEVAITIAKLESLASGLEMQLSQIFGSLEKKEVQ
ncbi:MAG: helix-turn-helix transcriptional regulator [Desulfobacterales bacterium]|nr:helix-turn-helix transcriptional regulator [Desulfobacterales bacterium]